MAVPNLAASHARVNQWTQGVFSGTQTRLGLCGRREGGWANQEVMMPVPDPPWKIRSAWG